MYSGVVVVCTVQADVSQRSHTGVAMYVSILGSVVLP